MLRFVVLCRFAFLLTAAGFCAYAQTGLSVSPQQVSLAAPPGVTTPVSQTVSLLATGRDGPFSADVRYLGSSSGWLSVSPSTGFTPAVLTITADPTKVVPGSYTGQVTFSAGSAGAYVNVYFTVGNATTGRTLIANPTGLTFVGQAGVTALTPQSLAISSGAGGATEFDVITTSSGNWLSVFPSRATTPVNLSVNVNQGGLDSNRYNGTITLIPRSGGSPTVVPVTLVAVATVQSVMILSQTAVTVNHQVGTANPSIQLVNIQTPGGYRDYVASTATDWIRLINPYNYTPSTTIAGYTYSDFGVVIEPAGLPPGTYIGSINVTANSLPTQQLPVSLTVTANTALNAGPSSLYFDYYIGGTLPVAQNVVVTATGSQNVSFTAAISPPSAWLSVSPLTGSTASGSQTMTVSVNPAGMGGGTYQAVIILSIPGGGTFNVPVKLNISGVLTTSVLDYSATSVDLTGLVGQTPSQLIQVMSINAPTHDFTAAAYSANGWLTVTPYAGTAPARLTVGINPEAVSSGGNYAGNILVTSLVTGRQDTIYVTLNLAPLAIAAQPAALTFVQAQKGGPAPPSQTIQITSNSASSFTVTNVSDWIKVTPMSGNTPATLTVSVDPSRFGPGNFIGTIQISGPNNQLAITITTVVPEAAAPTVVPASLSFTYQLGRASPAPQAISIGSTGEPINVAVSAATDSGIKWLKLSPESGTTPLPVTATIVTDQLVPGFHDGTITIARSDGAGKVLTVAVTLNVTVSPVSVMEVRNKATQATTPVAPGQLVTITGAGFGTVQAGLTAKPTAAGAFETRLGDVRVLFDGVPAPLLFVGIDRVDAIVPYALYGRMSTRIQVESGTSLSVPIELKIVDMTPGLFTVPGTGRGQASALNIDLTPNSATNPAQAGSVIALYGTGEGQTDPPGQDGRIITSDLRRPLLPVTATIAGQDAVVTYAGSASGIVSGVFQVNLRIPDGVSGELPVVVRVGTAATQSGVTIAVR